MKREEFTIEDAKTENIYSALWDSRNEPVISLENIAEIMKKVFDEAEIEALKDLIN